MPHIFRQYRIILYTIMDGSVLDIDRVISCIMWTDLKIEDGRVSINELGRCLRQQGIDVSNFMLLRISSDGQTPEFTMDHETFVNTKEKLIQELTNQTTQTDSEAKKRKFRAQYLDLWKEHTHSRDEQGEIPLSKLVDVVFSECNPNQKLLDVIIAIKNDGSESLNFEEFCDMLENLPRSGMIDEETLLDAFRTEDIDATGYLTRPQLYSLLIENGNDPLTKEDVDEMMEDCGHGDKFKYTDWVQRVITIKGLSEK